MTNLVQSALAACAPIFTWTTQAELVWLADQASRRLSILEIGTYMGATAKLMAIASPEATIYCFDICEVAGVEHVARQHLALEIAAKRVSLFAGNAGVSTLKHLRTDPRRFDMIWIDDGHTYADVVRDCLSAKLLALPDALICGHDYEPHGNDVARAVNDCFSHAAQRGPGSIWYL